MARLSAADTDISDKSNEEETISRIVKSDGCIGRHQSLYKRSSSSLVAGVSRY